MKRLLSILTAACLLIFPVATKAADTESQTSQVPPVAQALVREGDFAIRLAADLDLGKPSDEATAENLLATAGIAPANGWISDYPVTPQIIGQLQDSLAKAAADGKVNLSAEQVTSGLHQLVAQLNLPEPAPAGEQTDSSSAAPADRTVVNNYYYDQGPPIVTYYPPPADYVYLYDWVPYPVFWLGFWFPGFFICHNFTTTVFVTPPFVSVNATFVSHRAIVSNRIIDPATRRAARVDPVVRTNAGAVRPMTTIRAGTGRSFMTLSDMRRGNALSGVNSARTGSTVRNPADRSGSFGSSKATKGANSIFSRSMRGKNSQTEIAQGNRRVERQMGSGRTGHMSGSSSTMRGTGGQAVTPPRGPVHNFNGPGSAAPRRSTNNFNEQHPAAPRGSARTFRQPDDGPTGFDRPSGPMGDLQGRVGPDPGSVPRFRNQRHMRQ